MKLKSLLTQDYKIVEKKWKWCIAPAVVLLIAIIMCLIFHFTAGSAFNLGMDFTGGYKVSVRLGNKLTDDTYSGYKATAIEIAEGLTDEDGNKYGIKISSVTRENDANKASLMIKYQAVAGEDKMTEINAKLRDALADAMLYHAPTLEYDDTNTVITAKYSDYIIPEETEATDILSKLTGKLNDAGVSATIKIIDENNSLQVTLSSAATDDVKLKVADALKISDTYGGIVEDGGLTGATVSNENLKSALLAISVALVCMLVYIIIRFELLSGISAVIALAHDILMMFCFMGIFHIEINATFIAAMITILGYSINNTIIIFDRVRENRKLYAQKRGANGKLVKPPFIANKSVQETLTRSIFTTLTTLVTISLVAIIGVESVKIFALPIIFGLIAGTYSSLFLAPTVWAMLATSFPGTLKAPSKKRNAASSEK